MKAVQKIVEQHADYGGNSVMLAVAMRNDENVSDVKAEDWEDVCFQYGFEYIDFSAKGKNDFGENVGVERLKEALGANEWAIAKADDDDEINFDELELDQADGGVSGFDREEAEMTAEHFRMKSALMGDDELEVEAEDIRPPVETQATQVDDLDRIMGKLLAIKESSAELPEAQRKKLAAQAVRELLRQDPGSKS